MKHGFCQTFVPVTIDTKTDKLLNRQAARLVAARPAAARPAVKMTTLPADCLAIPLRPNRLPHQLGSWRPLRWAAMIEAGCNIFI